MKSNKTPKKPQFFVIRVRLGLKFEMQLKEKDLYFIGMESR
tara:strand:- start:1857 stop:1979 length:123 start_codon:yes stop_codon:yes gene_type:complete